MRNDAKTVQRMRENRPNTSEIQLELDVLRESYSELTSSLVALAAEDVGWTPLSGIGDAGEDGFTLKQLHDIYKKALEASGNPLLTQGLRLRTNNVFSRGLTFDGSVPARAKTILDKPSNKAVLFSQEAFDKNEKELFYAGNLFMAYRRSTQTFFPIPFKEITNSVSNPDLTQDVWYWQRTYTKTNIDGTVATEQTIEWYPVLEKYESKDMVSAIKVGQEDQTVVKDVVIIEIKANGRIGYPWGIPDVVPALPYAFGHAEYLRDGSKLLKALATIAWKITSKSKANVVNSSARMATPKGAAQTAAMTDNTDMVSMPKANQVDLSDGNQIAGYVASALGVSLISLLSDASSASGSYGAAATLIGPEANTARARQNLWGVFYERIYRALGVKDIVPNFPRIAEDPVYRQSQTLALLFTSGAIHQEEYRAAALELADVPKLKEGLPEATVFSSAAQYSDLAQKIDKQTTKDQASAQASVTGQGGNGSTTGGISNDGDLRNQDATPGTGS